MSRARLIRDELIKHFPEQAGWCHLLGSPFTAGLLETMGKNYEAGGIVARLLHDYDGQPRKDALGLRLTGCLHYAALTGMDAELAAIYPANNPGVQFDAVWGQCEAFLTQNEAFVREFMRNAPQTNETRRSIALLTAFIAAAQRFPNLPLHMVELGASAGLNTNWDKFSYKASNWQRAGSSDVHITTDWQAPALETPDYPLKIASKIACDLNPLDIHNDEAVNRIRCYVWADQEERLARLNAAIALARSEGSQVTQASADAFLDTVIAKWETGTAPGHLVIYHSVFLQYPPRPVIEGIISRIEAAGAKATSERPVSWVAYEPVSLFDKAYTTGDMVARLQSWPGGEAQILLRSNGHVTKVRPA